MGQSILQQNKNFINQTSKNGARGLALIAANIDHALNTRDGTDLAWLLNKTDPSDRRIFRHIVRVCTEGMSFQTSSKRAQNQASGMYIGGLDQGSNTSTTEKFAILQKLVDNGVSFRGEAVKDKLFDKETTVDDETWSDERALKYMLSVNKRMEDHGWTLAKAMNLAAAQEAQKSNA